MRFIGSELESGIPHSHIWHLELTCEPVTVAQAFHCEDYFCFLDSSQEHPIQGRYSLLAWHPKLVFKSKGRTITVRRNGKWESEFGNPVDSLEHIMSGWKPSSMSLNVPPFAGGAIGYLGYDLFPFLEKYENLQAKNDLGLPDCCLAIYDMALIFDHKQRTWTLAGTEVMFGKQDLVQRVEARCDEIIRRLASFSNTHARANMTSNYQVGVSTSNMTKGMYLRAVEKARDYIHAGDVYQVNLSQRFCCRLSAPPFELFSILRRINPSFYGAYLNCDDHVVISSSPELFLHRHGEMIETRPIKGTRPRGYSKYEDIAMESALLSSDKDAAELAMIVDLARNDLGRICDYGSVEVVQHRYVERLPTLFHTVSTVRGRLRTGISVIDILRATFPGGSITGCPKIRSIEIIDELEPTQRHVYTGSIGFIGFNGDLTLNIAIRSLVLTGGHVYYQAGGGIVADSEPEAEYDETLHKAYAIGHALSELGRRAMVEHPNSVAR